MKTKKIPAILCAFVLLFVATLPLPHSVAKRAQAFTPLDEIEFFHIRVIPRADATLDMTYTLRWKVLDSDSEGPLEWVKIGVPNCYVENIVSNSSSVGKAEYLADGGAYIAVYFRKKYYAGETVDFSFRFHQKRIYTVNGNRAEFRFNPGWFPEIRVRDLTVSWKKEGSTYSNANAENDEWLIWSCELDFNQKINVDVSYPLSFFPSHDSHKQFSDAYVSPKSILIGGLIVAAVVAVILLALYLASTRAGDGYYRYRGFVANHPFFPRGFYTRGVSRSGKKYPPASLVAVKENSSGGVHPSGGSSCACACACACAGGGRAGCARKDFTSSESLSADGRTAEEENDKP